MTTPLSYIFVREFGSRSGELHCDHGGYVKLIAKGYLTKDGSLYYGNGAWKHPGRFRIQCGPIPMARVSLPLSRLITQSMREARRLLGAEPTFSAERDSRLSA